MLGGTMTKILRGGFGATGIDIQMFTVRLSLSVGLWYQKKSQNNRLPPMYKCSQKLLSRNIQYTLKHPSFPPLYMQVNNLYIHLWDTQWHQWCRRPEHGARPYRRLISWRISEITIERRPTKFITWSALYSHFIVCLCDLRPARYLHAKCIFVFHTSFDLCWADSYLPSSVSRIICQ